MPITKLQFELKKPKSTLDELKFSIKLGIQVSIIKASGLFLNILSKQRIALFLTEVDKFLLNAIFYTSFWSLSVNSVGATDPNIHNARF